MSIELNQGSLISRQTLLPPNYWTQVAVGEGIWYFLIEILPYLSPRPDHRHKNELPVLRSISRSLPLEI